MTVPWSSHTEPRTERSRVVAGVDGSAASYAVALAAYEEARRRGAILQIVRVWNLPVYATGFAPTFALPPVICGSVDEEREVLDRLVATLPVNSGTRVEAELIEGHPAKALMDFSDGADLLVVGRRGHSRVAELLMGSTSRACVEHANCPVLVVPTKRHHKAGRVDRLVEAGAVAALSREQAK